MSKWLERYELKNMQAGLHATIAREGEALTVDLSMFGASTPSGQAGANPPIALHRTFDLYDLGAAKAWVEGVLLGAYEIAKANKLNGSIVGFFGDGWVRAVGDQLSQLSAGKGVK